MKWEPGIISRLFLDKVDHNGILFYYEDIVEEHKRAEREIAKLGAGRK